MRRLIALFLATCVIGCGTPRTPKSDSMIPLTRLPGPVKSSAYYKVIGVRYHTAWIKNDGTYQLRGKDQAGKSYDVTLMPDGTILSIQ